MKHFHMDPQVRVCFWRFYGQFCSSFLFSFLFSSLIFKSWGKEEENSRQKGPWSGVVGVITLLFTADIQHWPLVLPAGMLLFFPESWLRGHSEWSRQTRVGSNQQSSFNEEWKRKWILLLRRGSKEVCRQGCGVWGLYCLLRGGSPTPTLRT